MSGWEEDGNWRVRRAGGLKSVLWRGLLRISCVWVQTEGAGSVPHDASVFWAGQFQLVSILPV